MIGVSRFDYTRAVSFVRTLLEFKKAYRINEGWTFTPAVGAGMAFGSNKGIVKRSTNYFAGDTVESAAWSGFTWEAASGFAYQMERLELTLAAKYAAFPSYKGDSARGLAKIDWGTVGFSIGLGFGGRGVSTAAKKDYSAISRGDDYSRQNAEVVKQEPVEQESKPEDVEAVRNYGVHNAARYDSYVQFAEDFISQREYVKALKAYDNALGVLAENDVRGIYIWERKGAVLAEQKNYLKAKGYYAFAIKTAKGLGVTDKTVVNAYLGLAYCLAKGGNTPAAIRNYKKAMQLSTNETTKTRIKKTIRELNARSE